MKHKDIDLRDKEAPRTPEQERCLLLLCRLVRGMHHINAIVRPITPRAIEVNISDGKWATYDFDFLTRLIVLAHDRCIRAEISASSPGRIKIRLHVREGRTGRSMWQRHPTLETAIHFIRTDMGPE